MCLIVDACVSHKVFAAPFAAEAKPIWAWLMRDGVIVYGGLLAEELGHSKEIRRRLVELRRSGRAFLEDEKAIQAEKDRVIAEGRLESNDSHIIALARVSGARVVFTSDSALVRDFTNPRVLRPRGRAYKGKSSHERLLRHRRGCRGYRSRR